MSRNPMGFDGIPVDFKYIDYLSVDDFLAQNSPLDPGFGELPQMSCDIDTFLEPPNSSPVGNSDMVLEYINQMLMNENMDDKFDMLQSHPDLEATEKPFYEIIGEKYPPSPDGPPLYSSPGSESSESNRSHHFSSNGVGDINGFLENDVKSAEVLHHSQIYSSQASFSSGHQSVAFLEGLDVHQDVFSDLFFRTIPASQFEKGVEEAKKFLPSQAKLVVNVGNTVFDLPQDPVSSSSDSRGTRQKGRHDDDFDWEDQRSRKQCAFSNDEPTVSPELFDMVLLCGGEKFPNVITTIRQEMQSEAASNKDSSLSKTEFAAPVTGRKSRSKKKQPKKEVVDLNTLLLHCAQTVTTGDHQRAYELLRQIRQHSSPTGDASRRVAHYFADGLEARLAGTGSEIYNALVSKRKTASDVLKAYRLYLAASPFKKVSYHYAIHMILNTIEKATRVHILDFGIYFGFQWPIFLKMLSSRPGGPPKLRITGIDVPQPGFRPSERIEETGQRLSEYAKRFGVPFEYQALAAKLDEVKPEDLHLDEEETLIVNCVFRLSSLGDETMGVDCARDKFLNNVRKLNPALFVNVCSNGSYGAPFFVTRFREALYHFSALFDMLEMTVPREHDQRLLVERDLYGKFAINVVSCEGTERVERPETYKQTLVRCMRAGFEQLGIDPEFLKKAKCAVKTYYHKDFSVDEDGRWLLMGWRGRIFIGLSAWKPRYS